MYILYRLRGSDPARYGKQSYGLKRKHWACGCRVYKELLGLCDIGVYKESCCVYVKIDTENISPYAMCREKAHFYIVALFASLSGLSAPYNA